MIGTITGLFSLVMVTISILQVIEWFSWPINMVGFCKEIKKSTFKLINILFKYRDVVRRVFIDYLLLTLPNCVNSCYGGNKKGKI